MNLLDLIPGGRLVQAAVIAAAFAAIASGVMWFVHAQREIGRDEVRVEWAAERERQKDEALALAKANAEETQRRLTRQQEVQRAHDDELARARRDAADARAAAGGLRERAQQLAAAARGACSNPAARIDGQAAADPAGVLADMLGRLEGRARILAEYADNTRIAGSQCERAYDALKASP